MAPTTTHGRFSVRWPYLSSSCGESCLPRKRHQSLGPEGAAELAEFEIKRDKALATLVLTVDPSLLYLLGKPQDPKTVWDLLQGQFQKETWAE